MNDDLLYEICEWHDYEYPANPTYTPTPASQLPQNFGEPVNSQRTNISPSKTFDDATIVERAAQSMAMEMDEEQWEAFLPLAKVAFESIMADIED